MANDGIRVKALETRPELTGVDYFYQTMYAVCGSDFSSIYKYCQLYSFTDSETLEAVQILMMVNSQCQ